MDERKRHLLSLFWMLNALELIFTYPFVLWSLSSIFNLLPFFNLFPYFLISNLFAYFSLSIPIPLFKIESFFYHLLNKDTALLAKYGGIIVLTKHWANYVQTKPNIVEKRFFLPIFSAIRYSTDEFLHALRDLACLWLTAIKHQIKRQSKSL